MNPYSFDWDFNYLPDSCLSSTFRNGDSRMKPNNSNVLQPWNSFMGFAKSEIYSDYLDSNKRVSRASDLLLQSPKVRKLLDFNSNSDKISMHEQTMFCPDDFKGPLFLKDLITNSSSKKYENQENCRRASFRVSEPDSKCINWKQKSGAPFHAVATGGSSKATDFSSAPTSNTSSVSSKVSGKPIGSTAAKALPIKSSSSYVCSHCSRIFRTKVLLKHHSDTHDPSKGHRCTFPDCERAFRSQKYLDNHINDHHRASLSLKCPRSHCIFVANKRSDLRRHISSNHRTPQSTPSPIVIPFDGTVLREAGERLTDEFFDDAMEVMSRNVNEIYASRLVLSPIGLINTSVETIATATSADHFSPEGTSSTISAPSFSNGGHVTGISMTPPPFNIPCSSPAPYSSRGFPHHYPQPSDTAADPWHTRHTMPISSAVVMESPNGPGQRYFATQSSFGQDCGGFPSSMINVHYPPLGLSCESNGYYDNNSEHPYASQCGHARLYAMPQSHLLYHHPQSHSTPQIPHHQFERPSQTALPFQTEGNAYGQAPMTVSSSAYHQEFYQQPYYFQQQSFYHESPSRQRLCSQRETQQMIEVIERSRASVYTTVSQQLYDSPAAHWSSGTSYRHKSGQSSQLDNGANPSVVLHAVTPSPRYPLGQ